MVLAAQAGAGSSGARGAPPGAEAREPITAAFDAEFFTRPDGYPAVCRFYEFAFPEPPRQMDPGLMYKAAADGTVDVISAYATDGRIPAYDLFILKDDKGFFPPYYAAPLVREATLARYPGLADTLDLLAGRISDEKMQKLNFAADEKGKKAAVIAREFLVAEGLLSPDDRPAESPIGTITIGSKPFTEQEILAEMMAALVEAKMPLRVRRVLNLGGTKLCFDSLRTGDLDLYAEYTGTGLVSILQRPVISDPEESYQLVKQVFEDEFELVWLQPFGFNNTYTLTMRRSHAERLGLTTISELAHHLRPR
jgi:osmoprotectant transport system permease protein